MDAEGGGSEASSRRRPGPDPGGSRPRPLRTGYLVAAVAVLVPWNLVGNLLLPREAAIPFALASAGLMVWLARRAGAAWTDLGLGRDRLPRGLRWGLVAAGVGAAVVVTVAVLPGARWLLADARFDGVTTGRFLYEALARIPVATALGEEIAFRGVVLGLLLRCTSVRRAVVGSSVVFGLWHVVPALEGLDTSAASGLGGGIVLVVGAVAGQVLVTTAAGLAFCWLRLRSGHVLAPALAHWSLNASGYAVGWLLVQGGA
jgi:membrane protease YdiL (CAAX protease family)